MANKVVIRLENVNKKFKLFMERDKTLRDSFLSLFSKQMREKTFVVHALKNINLSVKRGECLGIIGRNSSGKSTLLKIIAGIIKPDSGKVFVDGVILPMIELGVGFNPELTGLENIYLYGALLGIAKDKIKNQLKEIIEFSELGDFINVKLKYFSSGMMARLAFSIATTHEPDIILIDEVLAIGDVSFQNKCIKRMLKFKDRGKTIVFVSHAADQIKTICDRVVVLNDGLIVFNGDVNEGLNYYERLLNRQDKNIGKRMVPLKDKVDKAHINNQGIEEDERLKSKKLNIENKVEELYNFLTNALNSGHTRDAIVKEIKNRIKGFNEDDITKIISLLRLKVQSLSKRDRLKGLRIIKKIILEFMS